MNIILLGPPGAGKGTQAAKIESGCFGLAHLSTGDMLRAAITAGTALGKTVEGIMARGDLAPDDVVIDIIAERIDEPDCAKGFVLDGFPRNVVQARALDVMLRKKQLQLHAVVELEVDDAILIERIEKRAQESSDGPRADDNAESLKQRLEVYHAKTVPVTDYYRERGVLRSVDGLADEDAVAAQIKEVLKAL